MLKPKYPTDFDGVSFQMQDEKSEYFTVTLSIEMTSLNEFKKDRYSNHISDRDGNSRNENHRNIIFERFIS